MLGFGSFFSTTLAASALVSSVRCTQDTTTQTVTKIHVTCPCDESESTSLLGVGSSWSGWSPTFTNVDEGTQPSKLPSDWNLSPTSICYTAMDTKSNAFPRTSTDYYTTSCTVTSTSTATSVINPTASTITVTSSVTTTTTASATTDIVTDTETNTITTTITTTSTETDTETDTATTTSTSTTTIGAAPNFTPIDVSIPGASGPAGGTKHKRDANARNSAGGQAGNNFNGPVAINGVGVGDMFDGDVTCRVPTTAQCVTVTSTTTTTSTGTTPSPSSITSTTTITLTTIPGVSTTTTLSVTTTTSLTVTATSTTTSTTTTTTVETATATYYAACDPSTNQAYYYNGGGMQSASSGTAIGFAKSNPDNVYDCCVAGLLNPSGAGYAYSLDSDQTCYVFLASSCSNGQQSGTIMTAVYLDNAATVQVLGNLPCGLYTAVSGS